MKQLTKEQFAEMVCTTLLRGTTISFHGKQLEDNVAPDDYTVAIVAISRSGAVVANSRCGGQPFCHVCTDNDAFYSGALPAFVAYLNAIPAFDDGVFVCDIGEIKDTYQVETKFFARSLWVKACGGENCDYTIEIPDYGGLASIKVMNLGSMTMVIGFHPDSGKAFCHDLVSDGVRADNPAAFSTDITTYLKQINACPSGYVNIRLFK